MPQGIFRDASPLTKLTLSGTIIVLSFLFFYFIGLLFLKVAFQVNLQQFGENISDGYITAHSGAFKLFQVLQSLGLFLVPSFIIGYLIEKDSLDYLALRKRSGLSSYLLVLFIIGASIPFINYLIAFNEGIHLPAFLKSFEGWMKEGEKNAETLTKVFLQASNWKDLSANLLLIALLPAAGEELLFRGILQKQFSELTRNHHAGIWVAAFLFSFLHFQFYGFIPRLILGVLLGYIFYFSQNLWLPILAHFSNNAMAVLFYYFYSAGKINNIAEQIGTQPGEIYISILSLMITGSLLFGLYLTEKRHRQTSS
jgi:membrane protease YdiL (CAAX protease family)